MSLINKSNTTNLAILLVSFYRYEHRAFIYGQSIKMIKLMFAGAEKKNFWTFWFKVTIQPHIN